MVTFQMNLILVSDSASMKIAGVLFAGRIKSSLVQKACAHMKKQSTIRFFEGEVNGMNPLWALVG